MPRSNHWAPLFFRHYRQMILLVLICSTSSAWANADYSKASLKTSQVANDMQSYQLSGQITMTNKTLGQDDGKTLTATMTAAARWPDLLVNRQDGDMAAIDLGTGPEASWFYFGMMSAAYVGEPITLSRNLADAGIVELSAKHIYNFYNGIASFLLAPDLKVAPSTGEESVTVNGQEVRCLVFTTMGPEVTSGSGEPVDGPQVIYYDPNSGLVIKNEQTIFYENAGSQIERTVTFTLSEFSVNQDVDLEQFAFTVPAEMRVVDQLDRLTNPDSMTGEQAPDITFTDFEGETFRLSELRGQPVFIDFWATWCGPCKMEMPHIETLYHEFGKSDKIRIIAASSEDQHSVKSFLSRNPYSFQVAFVAAEDARQHYKTNSIPAGFVIDAEGVIRAHMVGAQTEAQLREAFAKVGVQ